MFKTKELLISAIVLGTIVFGFGVFKASRGGTHPTFEEHMKIPSHSPSVYKRIAKAVGDEYGYPGLRVALFHTKKDEVKLIRIGTEPGYAVAFGWAAMERHKNEADIEADITAAVERGFGA